MVRAGHRVQVLTSCHRLPPVGVMNERGVIRALCLYEDSKFADKLGSSFSATFGHECFNTKELAYRLSRFAPDLVWVWNMRGLSKSLLFYLEKKGLRVVYDLHSDWLMPEPFREDPWYRLSRGNANAWLKLRRLWHGFWRSRSSSRSFGPLGEPDELDLSDSYLCSEALRQEFLEAGIRQVESLPVIYPFSDENSIVPKVNYRPGGSRFMWAGRISVLKAPDLALQAVASLKERGVKVSLDMFAMGSPSERKSLRSEIDAMGLDHEVRIRGIRPGEQYSQYAKYDALLYTSRGNDPFPITVQEAILSKLPCVLAKVGGIPEVLDGLTSVIEFEAGDPVSLASAMEAFMALEDGGKALAKAKIQSLRAAGSFEKLKDHLERLAP